MLITSAVHGAAWVALSAVHAPTPAAAVHAPLEWVELVTPPTPVAPPPPQPPPADASATPTDPSTTPPAPRARRARVITADVEARVSDSAPVIAPDPEPPAFADLTEVVLGGAPSVGAAAAAIGTGTGVGTNLGTSAQPAREVVVREVALADLSRPPEPPDLRDALRASYAALARERGGEGTALVGMRIGPGGEVLRPRVIEATSPELAQACLATLRGSRWSEPLDREGRRVTTVVRYRCELRVR